MRCLSAVKSIVELISTSKEQELVIHAVRTNVLKHVRQQFDAIPRQELRAGKLPLLRNLIGVKRITQYGSMAGEDFVAAQFSVGGALPKPRELVFNFSRRTIGSVGQRPIEASHGCAQAGHRSLEGPP